MSRAELLAARASLVFSTDVLIRREDQLTSKKKRSVRFSYEIVECARTVFRPRQKRILAKTVAQNSCRSRQQLLAHAAPSAEMHELSIAIPDVPRINCA